MATVKVSYIKFMLRTTLMLLFSLGQILPVLTQGHLPDPYNKEDIKKLGTGRIIENDKTIIKKISLYEVKDFWITYEKDGSLHDLIIDKIDCLEFPNSKWGSLEIRFIGNKPEIYLSINKSPFKWENPT